MLSPSSSVKSLSTVSNLTKRKKMQKLLGMDQEVFKKAMEKAMSDDEVNRMMLDEDLSEAQRCIVLLKKPDIN
jgi:hypothetical protein